MLSLEELKPVSIALELIIGEPAHRVYCRFILRGGGGGGILPVKAYQKGFNQKD